MTDPEAPPDVVGVLPRLRDGFRWERNDEERRWELLQDDGPGDPSLLWYVNDEWLDDVQPTIRDAVLVCGTAPFRADPAEEASQ